MEIHEANRAPVASAAETPVQAQNNVPVALYMWILFFSSLLLTGYRVYFENHAIQIPLVHQTNDPSLYPNDAFASTLPYYCTLL